MSTSPAAAAPAVVSADKPIAGELERAIARLYTLEAALELEAGRPRAANRLQQRATAAATAGKHQAQAIRAAGIGRRG